MSQQQFASASGVPSSPETRTPFRRKRPRPLDARRRKLIEGVGQGMTVTEAGVHAGYKHKQAAHRAFKSVQAHLPEVLERAGYSVDELLIPLLSNLVEKLDAKETKYFAYRGVVMETWEIENHDIQLRAAVELCKILGLYPGKRGPRCRHCAR